MSALGWIKELAPVRALRRARYDRAFMGPDGWGQFNGVFDSYDAALAAAPPALERGYDSPGHTHLTAYEEMFEFDYPALLWIARFADELRDRPEIRVVDLGGHTGSKYRVYRERWSFPERLSWTVVETEVAVRAALDGGLENSAPHLSFTTDRAAIDDCDILFASGALQYLETDLPELLRVLDRLPRRLVLNKVPLSDGPAGWTLQNVSGVAAAPYHVMNRDAFVAGLERLGYVATDEWTVPRYRVRIPFQDRIGTESNSGLAMRLGNS